MRDIHRNPILYYLLIPLLIGIWPLLVWAVYLPAAEQARDDDYSLYMEAGTQIMSILEIDPDRMKGVDPNGLVGEFAYGKAVDRAANLCTIPATNCIVSAGPPTTIERKKRQDATIKLKDVSIVQVAKFLSTMQSTWVNLQCDRVKLTKRKGLPDQWEVDVKFIYYF